MTRTLAQLRSFWAFIFPPVDGERLIKVLRYAIRDC